MKNELLTIGPFTVYGYGLMIALGIFFGYFLAEYRARKKKMPYEHIFYITIWCVVGGVIFAKLLFWITEWKEVVVDPLYYVKNVMEGFVVYGGILGGILSGYLYCRIKKLNFLSFFDIFMPSVALAQGFGRIGCFLAGCCYGKETDSFCAVTFHTSDFAPNGVPLIPTQLYSSVLDFIHCILLIYISRHKKADGQVAACYLILYSLGRFILEFFRGDFIRGSVGILSTSQFISVFTGIMGVILLLCTRKCIQKKKQA